MILQKVCLHESCLWQRTKTVFQLNCDTRQTYINKHKMYLKVANLIFKLKNGYCQSQAAHWFSE